MTAPRDSITVVVTAEHLRDGRAGHCGLCPVALATGGYVGRWALCLPDGRWGILPAPAIRLIARVDRRLPVEPLTWAQPVWPATQHTARAAARAREAAAEAEVAAVAIKVAEVETVLAVEALAEVEAAVKAVEAEAEAAEVRP